MFTRLVGFTQVLDDLDRCNQAGSLGTNVMPVLAFIGDKTARVGALSPATRDHMVRTR